MTIYVDAVVDWGWRLGPSCHMFADTEEELHAFAQSIGLKRAWAQEKWGLCHYDLTVARRAKAIELGAQIVSREEVVQRIREARAPSNATKVTR